MTLLAVTLTGLTAVVYAGMCWLNPVIKCGRCAVGGTRLRDCRRCRGKGGRMRIGRRVWNHVHARRKAAR